MKRFLIVVCLLGLAWLCLPDRVQAASGKEKSIFSRASISKTLKNIRTGTRKVVSDTVDVVTLKKFRKNKQPQGLPEPEKPWLNKTSKKKKKEEKKSIWSALLPSKKKPKRVKTMKDFVGLDRPS